MEILEIIKNFYGMNTKEAKEYNKNIDDNTRTQLKKFYIENSKKSFYED